MELGAFSERGTEMVICPGKILSLPEINYPYTLLFRRAGGCIRARGTLLIMYDDEEVGFTNRRDGLLDYNAFL